MSKGRVAVYALAAVACCTPAFAKGLDERWAAYLDQRSGETATSRSYPFDRCFTASSAAHDIPKTLLVAIARGESNFDARAVSSADAVGVMQIRWPVTARHLGISSRRTLFDPCISIDAGARYMDELIERFGGDLHTALVAYNLGPTRVAGILKARGELPDKDTWYSQYIYDHLAAVLRGEERQPSVGFVVSDRFRVIRFDIPVRARSLVEYLKKEAPQYHFEWRRQDEAFDVNLIFDSPEELERAKQVLRVFGLLP